MTETEKEKVEGVERSFKSRYGGALTLAIETNIPELKVEEVFEPDGQGGLLFRLSYERAEAVLSRIAKSSEGTCEVYFDYYVPFGRIVEWNEQENDFSKATMLMEEVLTISATVRKFLERELGSIEYLKLISGLQS